MGSCFQSKKQVWLNRVEENDCINLRKMAAKLPRELVSVILLWTLIITTFDNRVLGQRTQYDIDREESLRRQRPSPPTEEKKDIGQFPYNRGETPIFNFDIGDEPFIETIPGLITGLNDMSNAVAEQTKVTGAYGKAFLDCPDCQF